MSWSTAAGISPSQIGQASTGAITGILSWIVVISSLGLVVMMGFGEQWVRQAKLARSNG